MQIKNGVLPSFLLVLGIPILIVLAVSYCTMATKLRVVVENFPLEGA